VWDYYICPQISPLESLQHIEFEYSHHSHLKHLKVILGSSHITFVLHQHNLSFVPVCEYCFFLNKNQIHIFDIINIWHKNICAALHCEYVCKQCNFSCLSEPE